MSVRTQVRGIICHVACTHHEEQANRTRGIPKAVDEQLAEKGFEEWQPPRRSLDRRDSGSDTAVLNTALPASGSSSAGSLYARRRRLKRRLRATRYPA